MIPKPKPLIPQPTPVSSTGGGSSGQINMLTPGNLPSLKDNVDQTPSTPPPAGGPPMGTEATNQQKGGQRIGRYVVDETVGLQQNKPVNPPTNAPVTTQQTTPVSSSPQSSGLGKLKKKLVFE